MAHIFYYHSKWGRNMKNYYTRAKELALYIVKNKATIRQTASAFSMAKSTVHYDLVNRLAFVDYDLYLQVKKILNINFNEKHLRGGEATKQKYLKIKHKK